MRQHVRMSGRWGSVLLVPVLIFAGAAQPDPVLPGPRAQVPVEAAPPAAAPAAPAARVSPAAVAPVEPVFQRVAGAESPRVAERAPRHGSTRTARTARLAPEQRGRAALDSLRYDWRALGYRVVFRPYDGSSLGTANRRSRLITVYVRRAQSEQSLRVTIAHELAHALDFEHGTAQRRDDYRRVRGLSRTSPWFPCSRCDDLGSPAGDFAEVFALWLAGPGDFRSRLKAAPDAQRLAELAPLFQLPRPAAGAASPSPSPRPERQAEDEPEDEGSLPVLGPPPTPRAA